MLTAPVQANPQLYRLQATTESRGNPAQLMFALIWSHCKAAELLLVNDVAHLLSATTLPGLWLLYAVTWL
jgi:hypothetical protein